MCSGGNFGGGGQMRQRRTVQVDAEYLDSLERTVRKLRHPEPAAVIDLTPDAETVPDDRL